MTRFTRVKSTHQRVEVDSTPWKELKETPAKDNSKITKKPRRSFKNGTESSEGSTPVEGSVPKGKSSYQGGGGGGGSSGNKNFKKDFKNKNDKQSFKSKRKNTYEEPESANFTAIGGETKGFGQSKTVKIFGQFWVAPEDAKRLQELAKKMQAEGISRKDILTALQGERRKAEKVAKRRRDKTCFSCRMFGHVLADCPKNKGEGGEAGTVGGGTSADGDICFKCGSTEHISRFCKKKGEKFSFASCFICSQSGHIARQCPKNTNGIYPAGGSCDECGSVAHLKKDCPDLQGRGPGFEEDDPNAMVSRVSNPFLSTEYEDIPEELSAADKATQGVEESSKFNKKKGLKPMKSLKRKLDTDTETNERQEVKVTEPIRMLKPPTATPAPPQAPKTKRVKF